MPSFAKNAFDLARKKWILRIFRFSLIGDQYCARIAVQILSGFEAWFLCIAQVLKPENKHSTNM